MYKLIFEDITCRIKICKRVIAIRAVIPFVRDGVYGFLDAFDGLWYLDFLRSVRLTIYSRPITLTGTLSEKIGYRKKKKEVFDRFG